MKITLFSLLLICLFLCITNPVSAYENDLQAVSITGNSNGVKVASGIYQYRMQAGAYHSTRMMLLMK
jgi:hypothetical protein